MKRAETEERSLTASEKERALCILARHVSLSPGPDARLTADALMHEPRARPGFFYPGGTPPDFLAPEEAELIRRWAREYGAGAGRPS